MTASIEKLAPIRQINGLENSRKTESVIEEAAGSFGNIFTSAVENVFKTDDEKTQLEYQLSVGELDNPAQLVFASTKYQIAFFLFIQLRNKALDAYSELTRISL